MGILVMTALYSINLHVMGRSNVPLLSGDNFTTQAERLAHHVFGTADVNFFGWEVSSQQWTEAIRSVLNEPFIVQDRITLPTELYPSLVNGHVVFEEMPEESNRIMIEWMSRDLSPAAREGKNTGKPVSLSRDPKRPASVAAPRRTATQSEHLVSGA